MERAAPRKVMREFILSSIRPGSRVLDIGCGDGALALAIARRIPGTTIECLDGHRPSVRAARRRFRASREARRLRCRHGYADRLSRLFPRRHFECVVANNSFHEFWAPIRSLREIRAVLKPQGTLLIAELTPEAGERVDDCPRYSSRKIRELLERAGFRIETLRARQSAILLRAKRG